MHPGIGSRIGPYTLLASRGRGGMGEVFEAHDRRLDRRVAIKLLRADVVASADAHERVLREARAAARVSHPNIGAVYDVLELEGQPAIVMELVEGETLAAVVKNGPLPADRVINIGLQLADAVAAAHAGGVVHRDLKPSNVVVTAPGQVKVLDFGVAKLGPSSLDETTRPGTPTPEPIQGDKTTGFVGTPRYAAPEQLSGGRIDARADVFAIGAILFELLTGRPAFDAPDQLGIAMAMLHGDTPSASVLNPGVPVALSNVVARALKPDPRERFQSAVELADALREAAFGHDVAAVRRQGREPSRGIGWSGFLVLLGGLVAIVAVCVLALRTVPAGAGSLPVVAVLPFVNATGDASVGDLGVGIADTLTANLTSVPGIVIARPASLRAIVPNGDARNVARDLGATLVLNGSVQRAGGRWRLTAHLVRADASVAWGREYEGGPDDLFILQQRLATGVAEALQGAPVPTIQARRPRQGTADATALAAYSEARALLDRADQPDSVSKAIDQLSEAIRRDPEFALAHAALGRAYWETYRRSSDPQWASRAIEASERALQLDPYQADVQVTIANVYRGTGRTADALAALQRAIKLQPRNDEAFQALGATLMGAGRNNDAFVAYQRGIELRPEYWRNHYRYGGALLGAGRLEDAKAEFEKVITLQPDSAAGYQALGTVYQSLDDLPRARENYEKAIQRRGSVYAFSNLGTILHWEGHYREAIAAYEQAAARTPQDALIQRNIGDAWLKLGDQAQAQAAYERALSLVQGQLMVNPGSPALVVERAIYEAKLGRPRDALDLVASLGDKASTSAQVAHDVAAVYALCGRPDEALRSLATAISLGYSRTLAARDDDLAEVRRLPGYRPLRAQLPGGAER